MFSLSRSTPPSYFPGTRQRNSSLAPTKLGGSDGRGIYDGCQPIGPLTLAPGAYDVQIDAQSTDADYQFTARSS